MKSSSHFESWDNTCSCVNWWHISKVREEPWNNKASHRLMMIMILKRGYREGYLNAFKSVRRIYRKWSEGCPMFLLITWRWVESQKSWNKTRSFMSSWINKLVLMNPWSEPRTVETLFFLFHLRSSPDFVQRLLYSHTNKHEKDTDMTFILEI